LKPAVVVPFWRDQPPLGSLEVALNADRLGFPEIWVGEMATFDAFALAGAIARSTTRSRLVVGPLAVGVRDPAALALGIASVSVLGERPADLALGASSPVLVGAWHGRSWRANPKRTRETVAALRPLLAGERSAFRGELVRSEGFRLRAPVPDTRLTIAAFGPEMIRVAGELADRLVLNIIPPAQVTKLRERLDHAARSVGREPSPIACWVPAALEPGEAALLQLRRELVGYLGAPGYGEVLAEAGFAAAVGLARSGARPAEVVAAIEDEAISAICATGDLAAIQARIESYRAAGVDEVAIVPVTAEDPGGERLLTALSR
jgi:probable F420-dependent oxidoreductase